MTYFELVYMTGHDGVDISIPQVVDDLGEVDLFGEGPSHVLAHPWGCVKPGSGPFVSPLVKYFWVDVVSAVVVDDAGTLIGPNLGNFGQFIIPSEQVRKS